MTQAPLIHFSHLKKAFGPKVVYNGLEFAIRRGETVTILGPSGSGKSVMLKMLIGLLEVDSGAILFDGRDVTKMNELELYDVRRRVAYLFQGAALFDSLTVGENVAYGLREQNWNTMSDEEIRRRVAQSLESVGLPGIEEMRPSDLSGGMKKRAAIARALALDPELVFLDEPSAGLDPITSSELDDLILMLNRSMNLTVVIVTHELESIFKIASRVILLDKETRSVIAEGVPKELAKSDDPRARKFFHRESRSA
ncbi:MAG: ATP-binding cassette domain-containing protein [Labilithrix sp.]|nr:ATP-binding cassette domain-containing protein [Labilithrix sp.]